MSVGPAYVAHVRIMQRLAQLAAATRTHPHAIRADYEEERDRLLATFGDDQDLRDACEQEALAFVEKKFHDLAASMRPGPTKAAL